jgi:proteasome activator subunit 4
MKKEMKIKLTFIYWEIICTSTPKYQLTLVVPGLSSTFLEDAGNSFISFITDRALSISDFRIPWRPLLDALYEEMFPHPLKPSRHSSSLAPLYLNIAESAQRFFHPGDVDEMLEAILPRATSSMDSIIATQTMLVHFLPISHCEKWLPLGASYKSSNGADDSLPPMAWVQQWNVGRPSIGSRRTVIHCPS